MWSDNNSRFAVNICRLCANSSDVIAPIFAVEDGKDRIDLKIKKCLPSLQINEDDCKPHFVCITCVSKLEVCTQLFDLSFAADSKFDAILQSQDDDEQLKAEEETSSIQIVMEDMSNIDGKLDAKHDNLIILDKINDETISESDIPPEIVFMVKVMKYDEGDCNKSLQVKSVSSEEVPETFSVSYASADPTCVKRVPIVVPFSEPAATTDDEPAPNLDQEAGVEEAEVPKDPILVEHSYDGAGGHSSAVTLKTSDSHTPTHRKHIKPFSCPFCGKTYMRKATLNAHLHAVHTQNRPHLCAKCGASFVLRWDLTLHMRIHNRDFACVFCNKAFAVQNKLERHIRTHTGERPFACPTCGKAFSDKRNLASHERTHSDERPFACAFCGKSFRVRAHLTEHRRVHSQLASYACTVCGKRFKWKTNLNIHMKLHAGIRYPCEACGRQFARHSDMLKHAVTHDGARPYVCNVCGKSYADRAVCQKHLKSHSEHRPYKCPTCDKSFHFQWYLNAHKKTHTGDKEHSCDTCGKVFNRKGNLALHLKQHEQEEQEQEEWVVDDQLIADTDVADALPDHAAEWCEMKTDVPA